MSILTKITLILWVLTAVYWIFMRVWTSINEDLVNKLLETETIGNHLVYQLWAFILCADFILTPIAAIVWILFY